MSSKMFSQRFQQYNNVGSPRKTESSSKRIFDAMSLPGSISIPVVDFWQEPVPENKQPFLFIVDCSKIGCENLGNLTASQHPLDPKPLVALAGPIDQSVLFEQSPPVFHILEQNGIA